MWELLARGSNPYPDMNVNVVGKAVMNNKRPTVEPEWDPTFVRLMTSCWDQGIKNVKYCLISLLSATFPTLSFDIYNQLLDPTRRPTFASIGSSLEDMNSDNFLVFFTNFYFN
jgi:hypothetical protein